MNRILSRFVIASGSSPLGSEPHFNLYRRCLRQFADWNLCPLTGSSSMSIQTWRRRCASAGVKTLIWPNARWMNELNLPFLVSTLCLEVAMPMLASMLWNSCVHSSCTTSALTCVIVSESLPLTWTWTSSFQPASWLASPIPTDLEATRCPEYPQRNLHDNGLGYGDLVLRFVQPSFQFSV